MKRIPPLPFENPPEDDKIANWIAHGNPKTYDGKYDLVELQEWIEE